MCLNASRLVVAIHQLDVDQKPLNSRLTCNDLFEFNGYINDYRLSKQKCHSKQSYQSSILKVQTKTHLLSNFTSANCPRFSHAKLVCSYVEKKMKEKIGRITWSVCIITLGKIKAKQFRWCRPKFHTKLALLAADYCVEQKSHHKFNWISPLFRCSLHISMKDNFLHPTHLQRRRRDVRSI